ncbi:YfhO family protein [Prevotella sp. E13-17]|uniref:YfhO family protein n=1 Tax=Prevotella sp. E13-17 TaxID=2913616 RepID=UPI001EDA151C|nr:YfhO family protein [Prevotella sp. E13-17]UKK50581.1 YfhO family protein [Prevotella sp. E13-17]
MKSLKPWLLDAVAVLFFVVLAFAYFYPADFEGRVLNQGDISAGVGAGQEQADYMERTGDRTRWTNALFSGMPTYQLSPSYNSDKAISKVADAYHLWLPLNVWYLFAYLLGFYILLRAFDFRQQLAALGSILWAFSTYFLIIIAAGHIWKVMALAYLPPMIGGIVLAYRGKYLLGAVVTSIFAALEVQANHVQMTYYYLFVILFMLIAYLVDAVRKRQMAHFCKATAVVVVGGLLGILANISNLYHTWQYSQETMRGGSELVKGDAGNQTAGGLERSYITDYSYGIGETWSLLVPNVKGGTSTHVIWEDEAAKDILEKEQVELGGGQKAPALAVVGELANPNGYFKDATGGQPIYFTQYWEESLEPGAHGTMGPVYVGAFVLMLFVLGLFIVKGPMKWALLAATILSIMLAWGKNFMGLTDLFIDYVPMYAKFRAVESILVIAEFTIPLLAMLALKEVIEKPEVLSGKNIYYLYGAFAATGGMALLFALMPTLFFDFYSDAEVKLASGILPAPADAQSLLTALSHARQAIFTADCWRSFIIIVIGTLMLLLYRAKKLKALPVVAVLLVLCLVDLWQVNRRYLNPNDEHQFIKKVERRYVRPMTDADRQILNDSSLDYRVLNLAGNLFNENETSYYHKSIGGYHAAKLRRYQDLIDYYISREHSQVFAALQQYNGELQEAPGDSLWPVLNMLNTKYFLLAQQNFYRPNPYAQGNAWFVDKLSYVDNATAEINALRTINLRHEAVADKQFADVLGQASPLDTAAVVKMTAYEPNQLKYQVKSSKGGVLVFSEIYYPGWEATVDGQPVELGRVNYVLRAMRIEGGEHEVVLSFFPQSITTTEAIAYVSLVIIALLVLVLLFFTYRKKQK